VKSYGAAIKHESDIMRFWETAFFRMKRNGLDQHQRRHVASEMVRRGARPPTGTQCVGFADGQWPGAVPDIKHWLAATA